MVSNRTRIAVIAKNPRIPPLRAVSFVVADLPLSLKIVEFHRMAKKILQCVASVHRLSSKDETSPGKHCPPARKLGDILRRRRSSPPGVSA
jgi:hypothetical protein